MMAAAHQLHYLPWLRYFDKIQRADVFVALDDVQFNVNGWQNRNRIKGPQSAILLTVPIRHQYPQRLDEVRISSQSWRKKHWTSLEQHYHRAPFFARYREALKQFYAAEWESLNALNFSMLKWFLEALDIRTPLVRSSDLSADGVATNRLVQLCRSVGATTYLTGEYATQVYLDAKCFEEVGIGLTTLHWSCPTYRQQYPRVGFVPDLAIVDLLFNEGPESVARLGAGSACGPASTV